MPTVNARRFALKLRSLRERRNMTQVDVLRVLGMSSTTLVKYERAEGQPRLRDLRALLDHYGATEEERLLLEDLRLRSKAKGWWAAEAYSGVISPSVELLYSFEQESERIFRYSPMMVFSLFQTHNYARAIECVPLADQDRSKALVDLRLGRWKALEARVSTPELVVVLDEAVLRRTIGGPEVMIEQLTALLKLPDWVVLRVLPLATNQTWFVSSGFSLFEVAGELTLLDDGTLAGAFYERQDQMERASKISEALLMAALSVGESRQLIIDLVEVYRRYGTGVPQVDP